METSVSTTSFTWRCTSLASSLNRYHVFTRHFFLLRPREKNKNKLIKKKIQLKVWLCNMIKICIAFWKILNWSHLFLWIFDQNYFSCLVGSLVYNWCLSSSWSWPPSCPWLFAWRLSSCFCKCYPHDEWLWFLTVITFSKNTGACLFLRKWINEDWCTQDFFKKHGVAVMTIRELFDFIVDPTINDESIDSYLEEVCLLSCAWFS